MYFLNGASVVVGLFFALAASAQAETNLVNNPGFETTFLTDWTVLGTGSATQVGTSVNSGAYAIEAAWGPMGQVIVRQQIFGLEVGETYNLSFWRRDGVGAGSYAAIKFGTETVAGGATSNTTWHQVTGQAVATATSMFLEIDMGTSTNLFIDDISATLVTATPEPGSLLLTAIGAAMYGVRRRRKRLQKIAS